MKNKKVIIIGGGASGLVAAIAAARNGARVTVLEQKDRLGKKILSTGNGRCNFTNAKMDAECYNTGNPELITKMLENYGTSWAVSFFEELGLLSKERQGYFYPRSDQATAVLDALLLELKRLDVELQCSVKVTGIEKKKKGFQISAQTDEGKKTNFYGDACILACGGRAAAVLGSDGSGYPLAKSMGHSMVPVVPALVQLKSNLSCFKQLSGIRTEASVTLFVNDEECAFDKGELQLTNYGISGIPVFQISRHAALALYKKQDVLVEVDFLPTLSKEEYRAHLERRIAYDGQCSILDTLLGIFNKKLIPVLLQASRIKASKNIASLEKEEIERLINVCKHFRVPISEANSFEQAQICAGGVNAMEIDENTMESQITKDLYLTGELLDVDGICGGYNLHWAWYSGFIAGTHAAKGQE